MSPAINFQFYYFIIRNCDTYDMCYLTQNLKKTIFNALLQIDENLDAQAIDFQMALRR